MFDLANWLVRISYYEALFLGLLNFEIDLGKGRAHVSRRTFIYAALMNFLGLGLIYLLLRSELMHIFWLGAAQLHQYLFLVIIGVRVLCVNGTMVSRWWQRHQLVRLVNDFWRLAKQKPQVSRFWRRGVISKTFSTFLIELMQFVVLIYTLYDKLTYNLIFSIFLCNLLSTLLDSITSQFYFSQLNINAHYILLNRELRAVLAEMRALATESSRAAFMVKCCDLADRLEVIAKSQSHLQYLVGCMTSIFGLQAICVACNYYLNTICLVFFAYAVYKHNMMNLGWSLFGTVLVFFKISSYIVDVHISVSILFVTLDLHAEMVRMLAEHSYIGLDLDERLEAVYESFVIQLARNPLKLPIFRLFNMERTRLISMLSSVAIHSIVLIEYDIKTT